MRYISLDLTLMRSGEGSDGPLTLKDFEYIAGQRLADFLNLLWLVGDLAVVPEGVPDAATGGWHYSIEVDEMCWQNDETDEVIWVDDDTPLEYG